MAHLAAFNLQTPPAPTGVQRLLPSAPAAWLALLLAALWPTWVWMAQRALDRSDYPLGLVALAALAAWVVMQRRHLNSAPSPGWWRLALCAAVLSSAAQGWVPPLLAALLALVSVAAALMAFLPKGAAWGPVTGLSILSLPLLASLQFFAGYPLRVVTAEVSRWLLVANHEVSRSGSNLWVDGQLIMVDAPCSGVQMAWLGYFSACVVALIWGRENRSFFQRLPAVGALVLLGNVVRNTVLVAAQASNHPLPLWAHEAVGLLVLALVCWAVVAVMAQGARGQHA